MCSMIALPCFCLKDVQFKHLPDLIALLFQVLIMPAGELAVVKTIERNSSSCNVARAGDSIAIGLHGIDPSHVMSGGVVCHPDYPVSVASCLELKILVLDITVPILVGLQVSKQKTGAPLQPFMIHYLFLRQIQALISSPYIWLFPMVLV